jgi:hypothetical protein
MADDANILAKATNNLAVATLAAAILQVRQDASTSAIDTALTDARDLLIPRRTPAQYSRASD